MIEIKQVRTKKDFKRFIDFTTELYKDNTNFVHPLRMDEVSFFKKNSTDCDCDVIAYLALKDRKVVGRIAGIIQHKYNEKTGEKRVRFNRFDCINDLSVAKALLTAIENWAKENGMEILHGPMGANDLEREGLLVEGFDQLATFEEQYNFDYYKDLLEACGYKKEVDWLEYKIFTPDKTNEKLTRVSDAVMKKYNLHIADARNKTEYINKYKEGIFEVIDEAYEPLYGTVPFTDKMKKDIVAQFKLFIELKFFITVVDENDKVVGFGFAFPSLAKAVQKSKGKVLPLGLFRILKALKSPEVLDLALIGIRKEYINKGVSAVIVKFMSDGMINHGVKYVETNLNLENNYKIQNHWKYFEHINHKRRRSYVKHMNINPEEESAAQ